MKSFLLILTVALGLALSGKAEADFVAYVVPLGTAGNQSGGYTLGLDFQVASPITVTQLGVFDAGADGFSVDANLNVRLYDITNINVPVLLASAQFTHNNPGVLLANGGTSRFLAPANVFGSLNLLTGRNYSIVADGFTAADPNGNYNPSPTIVTSPVIATGIRYDGGIVPFPVTVPGGFPPTTFIAGTFAFVPEPGSVILMGLGIVGVLAYGTVSRQRMRLSSPTAAD